MGVSLAIFSIVIHETPFVGSNEQDLGFVELPGDVVVS